MTFDLTNYTLEDLKRLDEIQKTQDQFDQLPDNIFGNFRRVRLWRRLEPMLQEWETLAGTHLSGIIKDKDGNLFPLDTAKSFMDTKGFNGIIDSSDLTPEEKRDICWHNDWPGNTLEELEQPAPLEPSVQSRKPSLASMVQSADSRQKEQAAVREHTLGIQQKPEGR